jgi:hypothetical protein
MCWAARDSAADHGLFGARLEKAVGRQGGVAAASRGIRPRQGVARFEISEVQTLLARQPWVRSASAFCQPYWMLDTGWTIDFFLGRLLSQR